MEIITNSSYVQIELSVPGGSNLTRVYDTGEHPRFMSWFWSRSEGLEIPRSVTSEELEECLAISIKTRKDLCLMR